MAKESVKVRLQTPKLAERYRGSAARAIVTIVQEERVLGLYKGISSPLVGSYLQKNSSVPLIRPSSLSR